MKHSGKKLYLQLVRTITNGNLTISSSNTNWALNFLTLSLVFFLLWVTRIGPSCHFHIQVMGITMLVNFFMNKYNNPKPWASNCAYQHT